MNPLDRQRGCLLGLAIGDALGAAIEFQPPGSFQTVTDYRTGGPHGLLPGEWTDDTSMALALADSITQVGWDLDDQIRRYVSWSKQGRYSVNGQCFDIGNTVLSALTRFQHTKDARRSGNTSEYASGNGSIMRLAPVPIRFVNLFPHDIQGLTTLAAESSLPTHASPQCLSACRYFALILAGLIHGLDRQEVLAPTWEPLNQLRELEALHPKVEEIANGSFRHRQPPEIQGSGYVIKSLEAALWAFHNAEDFREAVLNAVNLGDDADTTGAVCGQLAGAYWGESGIPKTWLTGLARRDMIETALTGLGTFSDQSVNSQPDLTLQLAEPTYDPPTARCFWVIPDRLLAGAYPGASNSHDHHQRIEAIWYAGIRTFINLLDEQETDDQGVTLVRYDDLVRKMGSGAGNQVAHLRFPIQDLSVPSIDRMRSILDAIDLALLANSPVYIHCFGGVGRTGTVIGCWLLRHRLATPNNVMQVLQHLRQTDRQTTHRPAPETAVQRDFVTSWLATLP